MDLSESPRCHSVSIRPAEAGDYDAILAVWRDSGLGISADGRDGRVSFVRQCDRFRGLYLVAVENDRIVGVILGTHDLRKAWINRLAVVPSHRRTGIADQLVRMCETAIHSEGIEIITALVEPDNTASSRLFEKLGYRTDVPVRYYRKLSRAGA